MEILEKIEQERGGVANIHKAFMPFVTGVKAHYEFYKELMLEDGLPLTREERELLAVETSKANQCPYCIEHHQAALENFQKDEILDEEKSNILKRLARDLTKEPWKTSVFKEKFLKLGYSEKEWLHAIMVVSYFNFVNRCAHATGIELENEFTKYCK